MYKSTWLQFDKHPESDSCWSLSRGPDGRIYAAACAEGSPGGVVVLVRYKEDSESIEYLLPLDEAVDDPADSGRATQCKIHYSFAPSMHDGILYMATHLSGPPIDQPAYSPWNSWHDPERCFRGSALLAFDTKSDQPLWWDTLIPKEGCRCLVHDEERKLLYAIGYPRDHLIKYDLTRRSAQDLGRIGSINAQALFLDCRHRVWTTDDYGHLVRYDPEKDRIERSPSVLPHHPLYQTGWHAVFYDVTPAPRQFSLTDGDRKSAVSGSTEISDCVYATAWIGRPRLIRIYPTEGEWGRVEDLGAVTPDYDPTLPEDYFNDHCGGLTFAGDGMLYYVATHWEGRYPSYPEVRMITDDPTEINRDQGVVWRMDPVSLKKERVAVLNRPDACSHYVTRGAVNAAGDLFFGHVGPRPVGMFRVELPDERKKITQPIPTRYWG